MIGRWESRRVRLQGAGTREGKKIRRREKQQEELLGLGEVKVEGGEVVTAELVSEDAESRTEQPSVTVTYIISAADQRTVVAKLTSEEEKKNFFAERDKERRSDDASDDFDNFLTTTVTTPSSVISTPMVTTEQTIEEREKASSTIPFNMVTSGVSTTTENPNERRV